MLTKKITSVCLFCGLGLLAGVPVMAAATEKAVAFGQVVPNTHSLRDLRGNRRPLRDFKGHSALVLAFAGAQCPVSNLYMPTLIELEKLYRPRNVQFLAVYANEHDDLDRVAQHTFDRDVPFPVLKDFGQTLARKLGVTRVPTMVVLDKDFTLRYRGRLDDRYGVASRRAKATRNDLREALDEVLAGKKVSVVEAEADGCLLDAPGTPAKRSDVTYSKQVARIVQNKCQSCHRSDQTAPFALMNYEDAVRHGRMIKEVTTQRRMPPWHADGRYGHFSNDRRLTREEIDTLSAWVDAGMPRGDDKDLPKPIDWPAGWLHGKPDMVFSMPEEFAVPAEGTLPYKYWTVDTGFTEDRWVRIAEGRPGAPSVVHHIVVYIIRAGQRNAFAPDGSLSVLVAWAPGDLGLVCPPDTALRIPKGATLRFELHYTPNGTPTTDRSSVGITFAPPPKHELFTNAFMNEEILVPPHDPHYRAEATLRLPADARIISFLPHMHWRGKDYSYEIIYPDGKKEKLLSVPRWDFNWQNVYVFKDAPRLPRGARLHSVAHWDNSVNNPLNPAPDKSVRFGLQTWDEMMIGWAAYVWENPDTAAELAKHPKTEADAIFDRFDRDGDEMLSADEIPARIKPLLLLNGVALPDRMTREEFNKRFAELRKRFPRKRGPRDEPSSGTQNK